MFHELIQINQSDLHEYQNPCYLELHKHVLFAFYIVYEHGTTTF